MHVSCRIETQRMSSRRSQQATKPLLADDRQKHSRTGKRKQLCSATSSYSIRSISPGKQNGQFYCRLGGHTASGSSLVVRSRQRHRIVSSNADMSNWGDPTPHELDTHENSCSELIMVTASRGSGPSPFGLPPRGVDASLDLMLRPHDTSQTAAGAG